MSDRAPQPRVRGATPQDVGELAAILARAFADDPWAAAHAPAGGDLTERLEAHCRLLLAEDWLPHAIVDVAELTHDSGTPSGTQVVGVAVWERPDGPDEADPRRRDAQDRAGAVLGVDPHVEDEDHRTLSRLRPREPHWRLSMIAVAPAAQGRRVGSTLIDHGLARAADLPVALEATSPDSRRLYERSGFELVELITDAGGAEQAVMRRD